MKPANFFLKALLALSIAISLATAASRPAATGAHGMVVAPEAHAADVGLEVLKQGGNAVDAAVATALALAVTYPNAGNLGGGGFLLYRTPGGRFHAHDHRETTPEDLAAGMFLDREGKPVPERSLRGGLAIGVPGSVAGLLDAHRRWGSLPFKDLAAAAIRLAEDGFILSTETAASLNRNADRLGADPEAARIFVRRDRPWQAGDRLVQTDLAGTLAQVAEGKEAGFYQGRIGRAIVETVRSQGGVMSLEDLKEYKPVLREPVHGLYRGYLITSFPPPSSGGLVVLQILEMLEPFDVAGSGFGSSRTIHLMVEAERRAYADRATWMGDPDFFKVPLKELLDPDYLAGRAGSIDPEQATRSGQVAAYKPVPEESPETLHFSIADGEGGIVSMTTTLNSSYGSGIVARGTGILLNNEIDDFAIAPGVPNQFGLVGGEANAIAGGKRPLSSMTPTIVSTSPTAAYSRPVMALGSPGGSRIITSVLQVLLNVLDHHMPLQEAVDAPRFHHQWLPDTVWYERSMLPADVAAGLTRRNHALEPSGRPMGNVAAIWFENDGTIHGAADPRGQGKAAGH
ncbi:MAG: gamma-glutamyltransferase [Acidobacteria bacterium]|uniref:Glutathione hydrolase proenzyme n=1 Tax=Candidatus Polarisedimenticola svalbardensis TaxID=2886004 RepID=A0A8J6Y3U9_9BACT|nr:gamma-glutamyltransferase [Candidatus Polarisedimenticola svalbardensis]